jgi:voltage-gated potassium channel
VPANEHVPRLVRPARRPIQTLISRVTWATAIVLVAWGLLFFQRDGLRDIDGVVSGLDVLYFTIVTVTTLGYGDIVPVSPEARAMVAFGITPLRILIWVLLLTTAYELVLRRSIEYIEMKRLHKNQSGHFVICGFGVKGNAAAVELMERGVKPEQILVIDKHESALESASSMGLTGIRGDAASQRSLQDAAIENASQAIVVPDRDETCVLICLTIHDMAPNVNIIAAAREDENAKLIRNSGAAVVISPAAGGGRLLAAASTSPFAASIIEELYEHGRGADIFDYEVSEEDIGLVPGDVKSVKGHLILAVQSNGRSIRRKEALDHVLKQGDVIIVFSPDYLRS